MKARKLGEDGHDPVHDSTNRGIVVQRDQRIHLEVWRAQDLLYHHQPGRLEHDAGDLIDEACQVEHDLTE